MSASVELLLRRDLYDATGVETARATYEDYATINVDDDDEAWKVTVSTDDESDYGADVIAAEFANFALAETVLRNR